MSIHAAPGKLAAQLAKALGLPRNVRAFELRVAVGEVITCKVEMFPDAINGDDFEVALVEYEIVKKAHQEAPQDAHSEPRRNDQDASEQR